MRLEDAVTFSRSWQGIMREVTGHVSAICQDEVEVSGSTFYRAENGEDRQMPVVVWLTPEDAEAGADVAYIDAMMERC